MIVYTSICMNYLPKALILGESLKKNNKDIKFYVILLEREVPKEWPKEAEEIVDEVILAKDVGFDDFDKFIFKHSIVEAATSVKGRALVYLLENYSEKVVYLDPDICVYNSLQELSDLLDQHEIILTPHQTIPEKNEFDIINNELCSLQHGIYNLGFVAVRNGKEGMRFARWWKERLELYCYDDIPKGIFTDQRWCDLAPAYFDVHILKDPGYNFAPWNLTTRKLKKKNGKIKVNDKYELFFIHYSGFDSGANEVVYNYYAPDKNSVENQLRDEYIKIMYSKGQNYLGDYHWSYDSYFDGSAIERNIRIKYRDKKYFQVIDVNPFSLSNEHLQVLLSEGEENLPMEPMPESVFRNLTRRILPLKVRKAVKKIYKKD